VTRRPHGPFLLDDRIEFPPVHLADEHGLLAIGGDLSVPRLLLAYGSGIFPWPWYEQMPMFWWAPDPRYVLYPDELKVPRSLRAVLNRGDYEIRYDTAFREVIEGCAEAPRPGQDGTWITDDMVQAYIKLHEKGYAHSVETFYDGRLVGGLYGVSLGGVFFGESMFYEMSNASKVALYYLVEKLGSWNFDFIDSQVPNDHMKSLGGQEVKRPDFLNLLSDSLQKQTKRGKWVFD